MVCAVFEFCGRLCHCVIVRVVCGLRFAFYALWVFCVVWFAKFVVLVYSALCVMIVDCIAYSVEFMLFSELCMVYDALFFPPEILRRSKKYWKLERNLKL